MNSVLRVGKEAVMQAQARPWIPGERFLEAGQDIGGLRKDSGHTSRGCSIGWVGSAAGPGS